MATKKKIEKKPRELTLYFETEEDCINARDTLGQSRRRPTDVDRSHGGSYSKTTGHYGQVTKGGNVYRVPIRYKLIIDGEALDTLTWEQKQSLKFVDGDSENWIVQ